MSRSIRPFKEDATHEQGALLASPGGLTPALRRRHLDMDRSYKNHNQVCSAGVYRVFDILSIRRGAGRLDILRTRGSHCLRRVVAWKVRADLTLQNQTKALVDRSALISAPAALQQRPEVHWFRWRDPWRRV